MTSRGVWSSFLWRSGPAAAHPSHDLDRPPSEALALETACVLALAASRPAHAVDEMLLS
jgi:hypothetical protein